MLGVAGSLSSFLSLQLLILLASFGGGQIWRCGLLAGQANNLSGLDISIQSDGERLIINFSGSNDISMCTCDNEGFTG